MKYSLLVLLTTAMCAYGQPVEGPWVVMEVDSTHNLGSMVMALAGQETIRVFFVSDSSGQYAECMALYGIEDHSLIEAPTLLRTDSINNILEDAAADTSDGWALIFDRQWGSSGRNTMEMAGDSSSHYEYLVGTSYPWNQVYGGECTSWIDLAPRVGGGWIMTWVQTHISTIFYEPETQIYVAGVTSDSVLYRQPLVPYECQLFGPNWAVGVSVSPDTSIVLTEAPWCWEFGPSWGTTLVRAVASADPAVLDTLCRLNCDIHPLEITQSQQGSYRAYLSPNSLWSVSDSGACDLLGSLVFNSAPTRLAFHPDFGYAGIWFNPSWIKISRMNLDGTGMEPEVFYWRSDDYRISEADLAIDSEGRIHVMWTEAANGSANATRLMEGWINWDSPLSASPSDFIPQPSSLSLSAYPNPFNSELQIQYDLPRAEVIEIAVYNVLGQQVAELVNTTQLAGSHAATWSAHEGSGIYFVQMRTAEQTRTQKVLLAR